MKIAKGKTIEPRLYRKILALMPIPCVDAVVVYRRNFLLAKRKNKPAKGKWWLIGGRILKGESLKQALLRKVREETGLHVKVRRLLTARETLFKESAQGPSSHTINTVFLVKSSGKRELSPDSQSSELKWFSKINRRWPKYVKEMLTLAGFKH